MRSTHAVNIKKFQSEIRDYYARHGRDLPWRRTHNPYRILVSEIMLQQTQVDRVIPKYEAFLEAFPDFRTLARAPIAAVLREWQGLGYNRRALMLKKLAHVIVEKHDGTLPRDAETLCTLPGIGPATAGAILAFVFNIPAAFIETNIRRVFIHFFFKNKKGVRDKDVLRFVERALDRKNPREWYFALMDYGSMLGRTGSNPNKRSAHYIRQAPFVGSNRKLRGEVLKILLAKRSIAKTHLQKLTQQPAPHMQKIILSLEKDGFVTQKRNMIAVVQ